MAKEEGLDGKHLILNGTPKTVAIDAVRQHPDNYRSGDLTAITESIETNKFYGRPIVQKSTGFILAGNHRYLALLKLGAKEIPIEEIDVDDETARRILLVDNKSSDNAENDETKVAALLKLVSEKNADLTGTGWTTDQFNDIIARSEKVDGDGGKPGKKSRGSSKSSGGGTAEGYSVTVICGDEDQQQRVYESLVEDGYTVKMGGVVLQPKR